MITADIIASIESNNRMDAVRFEPLHRPKESFIAQMMQQCACNRATAIVLCSSSWGLFQIMGDNLLWLGWKQSPMAFCFAGRTTQEAIFTTFLERNHIDFTVGQLHDKTLRDHFASLYNGSGNVDVYSQKILETMNHLEGAKS